jgi:hypothetical protein
LLHNRFCMDASIRVGKSVLVGLKTNATSVPAKTMPSSCSRLMSEWASLRKKIEILIRGACLFNDANVRVGDQVQFVSWGHDDLDVRQPAEQMRFHRLNRT